MTQKILMVASGNLRLPEDPALRPGCPIEGLDGYFITQNGWIAAPGEVAVTQSRCRWPEGRDAAEDLAARDFHLQAGQLVKFGQHRADIGALPRGGRNVALDHQHRWELGLRVAQRGLIAGTALATIYVGFRMGQSLATLDPLSPWFLTHPQALDMPAVRNLALLLTGLVTFACTALGLGAMTRARLNTYDEAHWQGRREMRRNGMITPLAGGGFVYAKLGSPKSRARFLSTAPDRWPHAMMIAPTGRGKGVDFVIPNLLQFPGSAVVLDLKSENFRFTAIFRQKRLGQKIWYFSPFDDDHSSHCFNPMARIAAMPNPDRQYTALNVMLDHFLTVAHGTTTESFLTSARQLFIAAALHAIETGRPTIGDALELMGGGKAKKESYLAYAQATGIPLAARIFEEMSDVPDKILGSYVSVLEGAGLALWKDPNVRRVTSRSDFDFASFRREPQTLYIAMKREDLETLAPLVRLLFADAIATLQRAEPGRDEPHPVMFLLRRIRPARPHADRRDRDQDHPLLRRALLHHQPVAGGTGRAEALRPPCPSCPAGGRRGAALHDPAGDPYRRGHLGPARQAHRGGKKRERPAGAVAERERQPQSPLRGAPADDTGRTPALPSRRGDRVAAGPAADPGAAHPVLRGPAVPATGRQPEWGAVPVSATQRRRYSICRSDGAAGQDTGRPLDRGRKCG